MINEFENQEYNGANILDEALNVYLQVFYNQINSIENLGFFPELKEVKKQAMRSQNGKLVGILNQIERGKILEFLPLKKESKKYEVSVIYSKV